MLIQDCGNGGLAAMEGDNTEYLLWLGRCIFFPETHTFLCTVSFLFFQQNS
jgi:hypothetical protein